MNSTNKITNQTNLLKNLKSVYVLKKLFNNLERKIILDVVKYNKNIKERIDIVINDYKEYFETHSLIEIEIIPIKNKYDKFINIINKEDKKYYHIYFNDDKKEIKRNCINKGDKVKKIKIIIDYEIKSFSRLFSSCNCIKYIYFKKFHRKDITDMSGMFYNCSSLKELNLKNFDTKNVANMGYMFYNCSSLKELNVKSFESNSVTNMGYMFYKCSSLDRIDLDNFIMNEEINTKDTFSKCSKDLIIGTKLPNFNNNNSPYLLGPEGLD